MFLLVVYAFSYATLCCAPICSHGQDGSVSLQGIVYFKEHFSATGSSVHTPTVSWGTARNFAQVPEYSGGLAALTWGFLKSVWLNGCNWGKNGVAWYCIYTFLTYKGRACLSKVRMCEMLNLWFLVNSAHSWQLQKKTSQNYSEREMRHRCHPSAIYCLASNIKCSCMCHMTWTENMRVWTDCAWGAQLCGPCTGVQGAIPLSLHAPN